MYLTNKTYRSTTGVVGRIVTLIAFESMQRDHRLMDMLYVFIFPKSYCDVEQHPATLVLHPDLEGFKQSLLSPSPLELWKTCF